MYNLRLIRDVVKRDERTRVVQLTKNNLELMVKTEVLYQFNATLSC